jgi:hypothetical protein
MDIIDIIRRPSFRQHLHRQHIDIDNIDVTFSTSMSIPIIQHIQHPNIHVDTDSNYPVCLSCLFILHPPAPVCPIPLVSACIPVSSEFASQLTPPPLPLSFITFITLSRLR